MKRKVEGPPKRRSVLLKRLFAVSFAVAVLFTPGSSHAYSVLSHEEVVDMAWKQQIVPMLRARFPGITEDDLRQAHAYAYGGSVIQDIGYYPFGSRYFSDLLHYVRPNDFVTTLIRDSTTPNEYAFALGALAHYCGDIIGHPYVNLATSDENPALRRRFGQSVTYAENPTAHVRTEFGFDVVMVAQGAYSQENYRDFIGFQVAKPLLERAFLETYGMPMSDIIKHEDLAISTYRHAVSGLIPKMTKVAFVSYKDQIEKAAPGTEKSKFVYRLNQTEYVKQFGTDYTHVSAGGRFVAFLIGVLPKVGPLRALKVTIPTPKQQDIYLKSINQTVDRYKGYLSEIHAAPAPLPVPVAKDADDARKAAMRLDKDAAKFSKLAAKAKDPDEKAEKEKVAANVEKTAEKASDAAARTEAKVKAVEVAPANAVDNVAKGVSAPTTPILPDFDLDTGKPSSAGEYKLADETYAHLLNDLMKRTPPAGSAAAPPVDQALASNIRAFFAHPVPHVGAAPSAREAKEETALDEQVKEDLGRLNALRESTQGAGKPSTR